MCVGNIYLNGFKSFVSEAVALKSLTLLTGLNNSGKSSVIQAVRMLQLAYKGSSPLIAGHGNVHDLRSKNVSASDSISIALNYKDGRNGTVELCEGSNTKPSLCPELIYVGANRVGPHAYLPVNTSLEPYPFIGDHCEYIYDFINKYESMGYLVPERLKHEKAQGNTFLYALEGWLHEIAPGIDFTFSTNLKADVSYGEFNKYRPANVGFGLSYTLPIIAATLAAVAKPKSQDLEWIMDWESLKNSNGNFLILENPEAHLHPKGQTAMGEMIARAAACGVQVIVETHSEHVMDGIRIAVKNGVLPCEEVLFHYFSSSTEGVTKIETPQIDENGKVEFWPDGFFDQTLKNRAYLAKRNR
ncbi:AAA family ATPase [Shewanella carassii]|uniref:DUF3696 domain-containing protein n=1 Tax=Shewanella carassii TaxID=1987584 RepID=A0ABQ1T0M3_9GAMM|nr:DUF3696 domain-containing protein [Shewanella carassii]GGE77292.1 hypothetical protein GCM10011520_17230 [Shewanella carassii]